MNPLASQLNAVQQSGSDGSGLDSPRLRPHRRRRWIWLVLGICIVGVAVYVWARTRPSRGGSDGAAAASGRSVSVVAIAARTGDLPIYINGLGTVTPLKTVTIRARVEGQLIRVAFKEGQSVAAGDLLAEVDPRPFQVQLAQAQGQLARDQALLSNAKLDLERYQSLADSVTKQQIDTQAATVRQLEGVIRTDQAQIDSAELQLTYARITSPITGRVGLRLVDEGNIVRASDQNGLAVITQLQPINVLFTIPQDQIPSVLKRMQSEPPLSVDVYDRDLKERLGAGTLAAIDNQVDPTTGTVRLKAVLPNESGTLFPNQFVNARLLLDTLKNAVLVPAAAVQRGADSRTFVYVVNAESTAEVRDVTAGPTEAGQILIERGVVAGDRVVVDGVDKLQQGAKVTVRQSLDPATRPSTRRSA